MAQQVSNNPLAKHFRQPALYVQLTSKGEFWPEGSLELTATGEVGVSPMTAKDEITLRTPDALINGTSVVQVVQSCCPSIKDAWQMPSVDVDSTLIAIRIASYGPTMTVTAKCPKCNEEHDYDINLQNALAKIHMPDYSQTITTPDGLQIKLKPLNYLQVSKAGNIVFEEEKLIQALANPDIDEEVRKVEFEKHMNKMIELNTSNVTNCTAAIIAEGTVVTDPKFINDYYSNADSKVVRQVQAKVKEFSEVVSLKEEDASCTSCEHNFKLSIEFDYAHFFAKGF